MNAAELLDIYRQQEIIQKISKDLKKATSLKVALQGLKGSSRALLGAALFQEHRSSQLYILPDREAAEYFQNDLQSFLEGRHIWLYPSPFKNDLDFTEFDNQAVLERTEILNRMREGAERRHLIVTYPEALFELVINQDALKENTFEVKVGDKLDLEFMFDFLVQFNFERTDFVYEAGSFSIRGGIIDIFSFANELPYRIELFDDAVESIRMFDPETQLSAKKLNNITIIPNVENQEKHYERISFFDFIQQDTLVLATDLHFTRDMLANLQSKLKKELKKTEGDERPLEAGLFEKPDSVMKGISRFNCIEWGTRLYFPPDEELEIEMSPQPEFNKNFNLLAEDLVRNSKKGLTNIIFSDQAKQVERLYAIFEDIGAGAEFVPIYKVMHEGFIDMHTKIACYTEHQIFGRYQRYKGRKGNKKNEALTLKELYELKPGDFVTHIDHGVGEFSGLEKLDIHGKVQEAVRLKYKGGDLLYVNIHSLHKISRYVGQEGKKPKMNKLGTQAWDNLKKKTKSKVKDIARDLILLYAKRKSQPGFAFHPDTYMQTELEASFMYEDTPDQAKTTEDVKKDMQEPHPMDRLVCGDVGFGKTEIAIRAAFKAVADSKQVAVLVPTTVLASQHYKTFRDRLKDFPANVDYISRFKTSSQQKETLKKVEAGKVDILIGTHRILSKDIKWKELGLLIIDEEQKFGVAAKEKLRSLKTNIDTLTLTATPIPRTLSFSLMGARDMSIINTPPPNRQPVKTRIEVFNTEVIQEAIEFEVARKGQVFFVHNRIKDIFEMADKIQSLVPHAKVAVGHAQMEPQKLEEVMLNFIEGYYDVLVSTNIVESGLDIPNANTILVNMAQNHGLSDLYQLRGRVGRSNKKAYCYLLTPPMSVVTADARKRLAALEEHTELGSGFHIAMKDMDIRGAGNILGGEQSGFIAEIGLEMYQKILQEAVQELKDEEFQEIFAGQEPQFVRETQIETDLELYIPDRYVSSVNERLNLYNRINDLNDEPALHAFEEQLIDRFGPIPRPTLDLLNIVRLKWLLQDLKVERATLKRGRMKAYFTTRPEDKFFQGELFGKVITYIQINHQRAKLQQSDTELVLQINNINSATDALVTLREIIA